VYKCRIETLNSDGDALKQECCLARIAGSGTQSYYYNQKLPVDVSAVYSLIVYWSLHAITHVICIVL